MTLLAGATLGSETVVPLRAEVRGSVANRAGAEWGCRLVVQAYPSGVCSSGCVPGRGVRPLGAVQLAVSQSDLRDGVQVEILQVGAEQVLRSGSVLVAWVEPGVANLAYDGLSARPGPDAVVAVSAVVGDAAVETQLVVGRDRVAA